MGTIVTYAWFLSFIQLLTFGPISRELGLYAMFYIYAGINLLGAIYTIILQPETKGKSIEEIEDELRGQKKEVLSGS